MKQRFKVEIAPKAQRDIQKALDFSEETFGKRQPIPL